MPPMTDAPAGVQVWKPPAGVEAAFFAYLFYQYLGGPVGVTAPLLGSTTVSLLAFYCLINDSRRLINAYWPLRFVGACGVTYLAMQLLFHRSSIGDEYVRDFVPWLVTLVVVHALCRREGFLVRFALVAALIGLAILPFLDFFEGRAELDRSVGVGGLSNSNALAEWFGFCCICFAVVGIETKRNLVRASFWLMSTGCLLVVGLTVSRGTLLSVAVALTIACRRLLRRGFVPLLVLLLAVWIAFAVGLFDDVAGSYEARGMEDTGRFSVWPLAIARWMKAPFTGVGAADVATLVPSKGKLITPHNSFIFLGLAAGIVPFGFFVMYWMQVLRGALKWRATRSLDGPFILPLVSFAFLTAQFGGLTFMAPWMIVTLTTAIPRRAVRHYQRVGIVRNAEPHGTPVGRKRVALYRSHGS
jgi:O-antigen ligase